MHPDATVVISEHMDGRFAVAVVPSRFRPNTQLELTVQGMFGPSARASITRDDVLKMLAILDGEG